MKTAVALASLAALAQESRLALYRLLVRRGPKGYPAGEISRRLDIPTATLSFHLKELAHAGLVIARRDGRFIHYSASLDQMTDLVGFLTEQCCADGPTSAECAPGGVVTDARRTRGERPVRIPRAAIDRRKESAT